MRVAASRPEQRVQPASALSGRPCDPVPTNGRSEADAALGVLLSKAVAEHAPDVVDLDVHPIEPFGKTVSIFPKRSLAPRRVLRGAPRSGGLRCKGLSQLEYGVLAQCFVHPIAG